MNAMTSVLRQKIHSLIDELPEERLKSVERLLVEPDEDRAALSAKLHRAIAQVEDGNCRPVADVITDFRSHLG
ncbi:hypothetical protein KAI87_16525 [Myxococcota bacterium]|nr:hypothetical protein [Myxococcota bacterium]